MKTSDTPNQSLSQGVSRRKFLATSGAAAAAFTIVPRHVLGGAGFVAPSEKVTVAYIGCGTQGLREMPDMLKLPEVQIVYPRQANAVFAALPVSLADALRAKGWMFYTDVGPDAAARLMCSWDTTAEDVAAFLRDAAEARR